MYQIELSPKAKALCRELNIFPGTEAFRLYDEKGIPLELQMELCQARGAILEPVGFVLAALKAGWTSRKAVGVVEEALRLTGGDPRTFRESLKNWAQDALAALDERERNVNDSL